MDKERYHTSYYIISTPLDEENVLLLSTTSGALIKLNQDKYKNLCNNIYDSFSEEEFRALVSMGFVFAEDEKILINASRENAVNTIKDQPMGITILTTSDCNAHCYYCYEKGIESATMSTGVADNVIDYIIKNCNNKKVHLAWFGGEPLLNYQIIDYITQKLEIAGINFYSTMISNGYLFSCISVDQLSKWQLKKVQITLDGIGEEYNRIKKICPGKDDFAVVIQNIKNLLSMGIHVTIRVNFDPKKLDSALKTIRYVSECYGSSEGLSLYCVNIVDDKIKTALELPQAENPFLKIYSELLKYGYVNSPQNFGIRPKTAFCGIYHNYVVVDPRGNIFKCEHTCMNKDEILGHVASGEITDKTKLQWWLSTELPYNECEKCKLLPCCQGGCKTLAKSNKKEYVCLPIKNCIEDIIKMYYIHSKK